MAHHTRAVYDEKHGDGWLTWPEVEAQVGYEKDNLKRTARLLVEKGVWPQDLPRPLFFAFGREGGASLYHPGTVAFLRDDAMLYPYAHFRGQRHSVTGAARPYAPRRLLHAIRGRVYGPEVIRQDVAGVVEQFRALTGNTWSADDIALWLFTGDTGRTQGKRSAYWQTKMIALMKWLSILAESPIADANWERGQEESWAPVLLAVEKSDPALLCAWVAALRPLIEGWCFPPKPPETEDDIVKQLTAPRPSPEELRRENVTTRIFRLLNRRLELRYSTRPGKDNDSKDPRQWSDVKRWEQTRQNQGHELPGPSTYGRFTWYDGRLYDMTTRAVIYEVPKARALYYPQNIEEVVTRFFRYIGAFVALGIATYDRERENPMAPLPPGHSLPWTCRFCEIPLHAAVIDGQPRVWCPRCFTESAELAWFVARRKGKGEAWEIVTE